MANERRLVLFPAGSIVKDPHNSEFMTRPEPEQSLHSGLLESSCAVVIATVPRRHTSFRVCLNVTEMESHPGMKKILFTREFHSGLKCVEFHPGIKFNLKENL